MNPTNFNTLRRSVTTSVEPEREDFVEGLIERGEAIEVAEAAASPTGAAHEIIGRTEDGLPIVRRRSSLI